MRKASIKVVEEQSEEIKDLSYDISQTDKEALLAKYYPEQYKQQYIEPNHPKHNAKPHQKRIDNDIQKSDNQYYDVKFNSVDVGSESVNFKIEINSDMKF